MHNKWCVFPLKQMGRSFKINDPLHTEKHTVPFKRTCFFIFGYVNLNNNVYIYCFISAQPALF